MPASDQAVVLCLTTAPDDSIGRRISSGLLEQRLAACVSMLPAMQSMYWWEGKIETAAECLLLIKTTSQQIPAIKEFLHQHHPYDTPELLCFAASDGLENYLNWVRKEIRP